MVLLVALNAASCGETRSEQITAPTATRCQLALTPPSPVPATANGFSVPLTTARECTWSIEVDSNWLTVEPKCGS